MNTLHKVSKCWYFMGIKSFLIAGDFTLIADRSYPKAKDILSMGCIQVKPEYSINTKRIEDGLFILYPT